MTFNRKAMFSSTSGEWETPIELFQVLDAEFHFTLDACATPRNNKCPCFYSQDALRLSWLGTVFCNPPYGREIWQWVAKGYNEALRGAVVVMLLPARTDTAWWHSFVMKADEIRFIRGRLKFSGHKNSAPFPSCIVVFRGKP